jgi:RNA polymerase sigma factor (TIGR02999 family)
MNSATYDSVLTAAPSGETESARMSDATQILEALKEGQPVAADELLPVVYRELRSLAAAKMAFESADHTLQPTALVHEAWLRLVGSNSKVNFDSRTLFFASAAEAMRRILIEHARRRRAQKNGGHMRKNNVDLDGLPLDAPTDRLAALSESLEQLDATDEAAALVARLRLLGGLTLEETAVAVGTSTTTAHRQWTYARAWLKCRLADDPLPSER